ncbi:UTP--glucose-1-phosphate uridylyltransferase [Nephila pilipes]|uniref:UTP--glucose-1-phosphate uridylyltransferase n=1 Tax=Nephila pilipes TaxID=299642 RepID=A0A8X6U7I3_NEPPI|nr:UTP--glucose-1-phosphate uridylyltransferase [Nephila pilipes]
MGSTMKCAAPKALIPICSNMTFLDFTVQQIENLNIESEVNVTLVLMNSVKTRDSTEDMLRKIRILQIKIHTFMQDRYPHISSETFNLFLILSMRTKVFVPTRSWKLL